MVTDCPMRVLLRKPAGEVRRALKEAEQPEIVAELQLILADLVAARRRHEERCSDCASKPTYESCIDDPDLEDFAGIDLSNILEYQSKSRREATRCSRHR